MSLKDDLAAIVAGEVEDDAKTLDEYSRDASLFVVQPEVVVFPKGAEDVRAVVRYVRGHKVERPALSITARAAGSDMTGGPLGESIILSFTRHFSHSDVDEAAMRATVEPGVFYRDFEKEILPEHLSLPSYPASKRLAALGGMIMNNAGGERTLRYGQTREFVTGITMVLSDGNEYEFHPLTRDELDQKLLRQDFEGEIYRGMLDLLERNYDAVQNARPNVHKNSAGYALWRVWNRERFDLTQLFTGSQGTLGIMTRADLRLIHEKPARRLVVIFLKAWETLPDVVRVLLPLEPESLETFDDATMKLGIRFMPEIARSAGIPLVPFALRFLPEVWIGARMGGMPRLVILAEFAEDSGAEVDKKVAEAVRALNPVPAHVRVASDARDAEKYWVMRRESFNLLRQHVKGKQAAAFVEDVCVTPDVVPEFLPKLFAILKDHDIAASIAGHAGDGNFHIIPFMDLRRASERAKIPLVADSVYHLVAEYGGSITAEHNDGIVRTPYLERMYGRVVYDLFRQVKNIFDPQNIFNPGKKIGGTVEYMKSHIITG